VAYGIKRTPPKPLTEEQLAHLRRLSAQRHAAEEAERALRIPPVPKEGPIRVVLLGCVKTKADTPRPAHQLYISPLWRARWTYAQRVAPERTLILSAAFDLVHPDTVLPPYERSLKDERQRERHAWAERVASSFRVYGFGPPERLVVEVHAGTEYRDPFVWFLRRYGMTMEEPLAGIVGVGPQIAWYNAQAAAA
jgi:hypothetical protein